RWRTPTLTRSARWRPSGSRLRASWTASVASTSTVARSTTPPPSPWRRSRWRKPLNVWIVTPAWRRYAVTELVLAQWGWLRDHLAPRGLAVSAVVVADDE